MGVVVELGAKTKDIEPGAAGLLAKHQLLLRMSTDLALSRADVAVGAVLLEFYNCTRGCAWPSLPKIAERSTQTVRNVQRCIARLTEHGYFVATKSQGRGNAKTYCPNFEWVEKVTAPSPFPTKASPRKDDSGVAEKMTAASGKGDSGVILYRLGNQLEETRESSLRSLRARERQDDLFFGLVDEEEDFPPLTEEQKRQFEELLTELYPDEDKGAAPTSQPAPGKSKKRSAARVVDDRFEEFWERYPRREAMKAARMAYAQALKKVDPQTLIDAAEDYTSALDGRGQEGDADAYRYALSAARWLREERWTDDHGLGMTAAQWREQERWQAEHPEEYAAEVAKTVAELKEWKRAHPGEHQAMLEEVAKECAFRTGRNYSEILTKMMRDTGVPPLVKLDASGNLVEEPSRPPVVEDPVDPDFEVFWKFYPTNNKGTRDEAHRAFTRACQTTAARTIIEGAKKYWWEQRGEEPRFTLAPRVWLERQAWLYEMCAPSGIPDNAFPGWMPNV